MDEVEAAVMLDGAGDHLIVGVKISREGSDESLDVLGRMSARMSTSRVERITPCTDEASEPPTA